MENQELKKYLLLKSLREIDRGLETLDELGELDDENPEAQVLVNDRAKIKLELDKTFPEWRKPMNNPADDTVETLEVVAFAPEEIMATDEMMPMDMVIVDEPAPAPVEEDYEKSQDLGHFMSWITKKMQNLPAHSGKTTAGCERVIAHLKMLDKEISKAVARDVDVQLDDQAVEKFRKEIRKMIKKLEKRHKEINEAYDADDGKFAADDSEQLVKNADAWKCPECGKEINPGDAEHKARHNAMEHGHEADDKTTLGPKGKEAALDKEAIKPPFVRHRGNKWVVLDKHTGKVLSEHDSKEKANGSLAAMHMHKDDDGRYEVKEMEDKTASACACQVEKKADDTCPTCKIKLWKAAEGLYECISCYAVFERPLTKEAGTAKLTLVMTPFERAITGAIVNSFVSQGKNPEETYAELKKKYKFTDRDELSIQQVLADMGYPMLKDRGHVGDESEQLNKGKGIEFSTQYNA